MVQQCFNNESTFQRQVMLAFQTFMNLDVGQHTMAELISTNTDKLLRKGGSKENEAQLDDTLDQQVALFSYLVDKDMFIEVYRNQLARRLIQDKSEDIEFEKTMITKLKMSCGLEQIKKLEGMLNDMKSAKEEMNIFEQSTYYQENKIPEVQVSCLTTANWPSYKKIKIQMPLQLEASFN